ncbi:MAG: hypothetical protein ACREXW_13565 [Gammaproteobacteria bacterium]
MSYIDIGRRYKITRSEMAAILADAAREGLDLSLEVFQDDPSGAIRAQKWANACTEINCISVCSGGSGFPDFVRYDQPGVCTRVIR